MRERDDDPLHRRSAWRDRRIVRTRRPHDRLKAGAAASGSVIRSIATRRAIVFAATQRAGGGARDAEAAPVGVRRGRACGRPREAGTTASPS
jgi:hypothetical protein